MKYLISILLISLNLTLAAQVDMSEGFQMLDKGKLDQAESFFEAVLIKEPNNKTALICFGRATGLKGNHQSALDIFNKLDKEYANDLEIQLNIAEANMWKKEFATAKDQYQTLLDEAPNNFVVNQGLANALAELGEPEKALTFINHALKIDPVNQGAKLSRKYIRLALAAQKRNALDFNYSLDLLNDILQDYPNDKDAILNKAIVFLTKRDYKKAKSQYQLLRILQLDVYEANLGLAYLALINQNLKGSISLSKAALIEAEKKKLNESEKIRASLSAVNAYGADQNYKRAYEIIEETANAYGDDIGLDMANARILVWQGKVKEGIDQYAAIEMGNGTSYELLMGQAEAYRSLKKYSKSIALIDQALELVPAQPDATKLKKDIQNELGGELDISSYKSSDNGYNEAFGMTAKFLLGNPEKARIFGHFGYRNTSFLQSDETEVKEVRIGLKRELNHKFSMTVQTGLAQSEQADNQNFKAWIGSANFDYQISKRNGFNLGVKRELQTYSSQLVRSGLMMDNVYLNYNTSIKKGPGAFFQFMKTFQSDGNERDLLFASIFYDIQKFPKLRVGANYLNFGYASSRNELYFSPENFSSLNGFLNFSTKNRRSKLYIDLQFNYGFQEIDDNKIQSTYSVINEIGYRANDNFLFNFKYQYSNSAQTTAAGFSFHSLAMSLNYKL